MKQLVRGGRLVFGAWMLANGANYFCALWPVPTGHEPLAIQLMDALAHSGLLGVAMMIQLLTGALILAGLFVPVALCVVMPVSTCALYWAVVLDHKLPGASVAIVAFALNGALMLAYIDYYRGTLQRQALAYGEALQAGGSFDSLFVNPNGRTSRGQFAAALLTLLAVVVFYERLVGGLTAHWCLLMLVFPALMLNARRLHDMGYTAWVLVVPAFLAIAAFAIWLRVVSFGAQSGTVVTLAAVAVGAGFALWGCIGKGRAEANRFGTL